ncbi:hypothetical protein [Vibrio ostreicida]|uniref:hypothetical protein n=1 Tax=Vibrio ostreicida TaxID=526588 RepID=UPI000971017A|nr:hypothetical protein [Vibrio ostreicida]
MRLLVCNSRQWFRLKKEISQNNTVKFISHDEELTFDLVEKFKPDYIFFPHWNWFVGEHIHGNSECVVFHTAPLPYGRGGSPIQNLIMKGFQSSPVCAIKMTSKLDAGSIYSSYDVSLEGDINSIFLRINYAINELIDKIVSENPEPVPQVGDPYIFKRLTESDNEIPEGLDLDKIYDRIRMVDNPDYPNAYIMYGDAKLEFYDASLENDSLEVTCKITKSK